MHKDYLQEKENKFRETKMSILLKSHSILLKSHSRCHKSSLWFSEHGRIRKSLSHTKLRLQINNIAYTFNIMSASGCVDYNGDPTFWAISPTTFG